MVVGLLGNESSDSNRFTLVTPKPANGVRLQATLGNQNPTGLPVGAVSPNKEVSQEYVNAISTMNWHGVIDSVESSRKLPESLWAMDADAVAEGIMNVS